MVSQLVPKFLEVSRLLTGTDQLMARVVQYYREFNNEGEKCIPMLAYMVVHGDENVALWEFRRGNKGAVSQELNDREAHKYDLYSRFDKIVF